MKHTSENMAAQAGKEFKQISDTLQELDGDITKLEEMFNTLEADFLELQLAYKTALEIIDNLSKQIK
jgi:signal recognition particle GTPase